MGDTRLLSWHELDYQRSQEGKGQAGMIPWDRHTPEGKGGCCSVLYLISTHTLLNNNAVHIMWDDFWYLGGKSNLVDMWGIVGSGIDMDDRCPPHTRDSSCFWILWPHWCWQAWNPLHMISWQSCWLDNSRGMDSCGQRKRVIYKVRPNPGSACFDTLIFDLSSSHSCLEELKEWDPSGQI